MLHRRLTLEQLEIKSPCPAAWDAMSAAALGDAAVEGAGRVRGSGFHASDHPTRAAADGPRKASLPVEPRLNKEARSCPPSPSNKSKSPSPARLPGTKCAATTSADSASI